jgi:hypothetical protein
MAELLRVQQDIAVALRDSGAFAPAVQHLAGDTALVQRRLGLYRANVAAAISKALCAAYPVIQQVVGDEFFDALARAYQRDTPSTSGDLYDYGVEFSAFLSTFTHVQSLPYLSDLACLEWAAHRAYGAGDAPDWDPTSLAIVSPEQRAAIRFVWAPGTTLVASAFPLARIWTIHQTDYDGQFEVDWSIAERALVARDGFRVTVSAIAASDAAFIASGLSGGTIDLGVAAALSIDSAFDLGGLLARAFASHLICGFTLNEEQ